MPPKPDVVLTRPIREALELRVRSRSSRADDARKARLILMLADGETFDAIVDGLRCSPSYVSRWKKRFLEDSLTGLHSRHLGKAAKVLTPAMEGRILAATRRKPADGSTHWTFPSGSRAPTKRVASRRLSCGYCNFGSSPAG